MRLALECRRRVKEQQKRIGSAEFRNTHFSYTLGQDGVEKFVVTPELQSEDSIGSDPLPPGQIWTISPGGLDENAGLYRIEVTEGPGSGVKILNRPAPAPFSESVRYAEQNLYSRAKQLTGDRDPREHEFSVQLRAFDAAKSGNATGLAVLVALCSALLQKSIKGGLVVVGSLNLGGSIDPVHNAVNVAELAIEQGRDHAAGAGVRPEAAQRPARRPHHEGQHPLLHRRPRGAAEGDSGVTVEEWATQNTQKTLRRFIPKTSLGHGSTSRVRRQSRTTTARSVRSRPPPRTISKPTCSRSIEMLPSSWSTMTVSCRIAPYSACGPSI